MMQPLIINQHLLLLNSHKESIRSYFVQHLEWNSLYKYLLIPISPYPSFNVAVRVHTFKWSGEEKLLEKPGIGVRRHYYENTFNALCNIRFNNINAPYELTTIEHTFDLTCKFYFDLNVPNLGSIELLNDQRRLLSNINGAIFDFYKQSGISDDDFDLGGELLSERFRQSLFNNQPPLQVVPFDVWHELLYCLQRTRFSIGNMAMYKPFLDNPLWHRQYFHDRYVYPSYSTTYDERYFTYCEFTYQSLYHFWDRIGDTLAIAVPTNLNPFSIDFARVIEAINRDQVLSVNPHFQWLFNFKSNDYQALNADRKQTVHYETITTRMNREHMAGFNDLALVEQRQAWIEGRMDYFINHFHKCVEGLRQLTLFLETK